MLTELKSPVFFIRALLWLSVLIPLSVDNQLSYRWSYYDFRYGYFTFALAFLFEIGLWAKSVSSITFLNGRFLNEGFKNLVSDWTLSPRLTLAIFALLLVGFLGVSVSLNPMRSFFSTLWAAGTILGSSLYFARVRGTFLKFIVFSLMSYAAFQSLVVVLDSVLCLLGGAQSVLGRVLIYNFATQTPFCRPHAFYQEPGYLAGFLLLCLLIQNIWKTSLVALPESQEDNHQNTRQNTQQDSRQENQLGKQICFFSSLLFSVAILLSTSRMGILGLSVYWVVEFMNWIIRYFKRDRNYSFQKYSFRKIVLPISISVAVVVLLLSSNWSNIDAYLLHSQNGILSDGSINFRIQKLVIALRIFSVSPFIGVGPGAAGAYFVEKMKDNHDWWGRMNPSDSLAYEYQAVSNDPFSLNLYTEILSEWGILGMLAFILILFEIIRKIPSRSQKIQFIGILGVLYSATQTLQRFDLWVCLFLIVTIGRQLEGKSVMRCTQSAKSKQ